ncbi:hypothetical protein [Haloferula sp.]|uniref:hypothetical protein n=1 Tax=Haloferula sp. TaxID=2497595 RepID=UPI00329C8834
MTSTSPLSTNPANHAGYPLLRCNSHAWRHAICRWMLCHTLLLLVVAALAGPTASAQPTFIPFEGTNSPDGRYCLAWGMGQNPLDLSNMDRFIEKFDPYAVENYLIDLEKKTIVAVLGTQHYAVKSFSKNRGAIFASWRKDSKALLVEEPHRFGSAAVVLVYLGNSGQSFGTGFDAIPLTGTMKREALAKMLEQHPAEKETILSFTISFTSIEWTGDYQFKSKVIGEVPKDPDSFLYDKEMIFQLPKQIVKAE